MIRITTEMKGNFALITIDGQVEDADVSEIRRIRKSVQGEVFLNLLGVKSCTTSGSDFLRTWLDAGAKLQSATPCLEMILNLHDRK